MVLKWCSLYCQYPLVDRLIGRWIVDGRRVTLPTCGNHQLCVCVNSHCKKVECIPLQEVTAPGFMKIANAALLQQTEVFDRHTRGPAVCNLANIVCVFNIAIECELVRRKQSECCQVKASCYM